MAGPMTGPAESCGSGGNGSVGSDHYPCGGTVRFAAEVPSEVKVAEQERRDWIVYVPWKTIAAWKQAKRSSKERGPYAYASNQTRFKNMRCGDCLWVLTLPRFEGYCQAPSIVARLMLDRDVVEAKQLPTKSSEGAGEWDVRRFGKYVVYGRREPHAYPVLYNAFDAVRHLEFESRDNPNLSTFEDALRKGFGRSGPYGSLAQCFRTLRKLTPASARQLDELHDAATNGRRVFLSYRSADVAVLPAREKGQWMAELVAGLKERGYLCWWDELQLVGRQQTWAVQEPLIKRTLEDGIQQATWLIGIGTSGYGGPGGDGKAWTADEWDVAGKLVYEPIGGGLRRLFAAFPESGARLRRANGTQTVDYADGAERRSFAIDAAERTYFLRLGSKRGDSAAAALARLMEAHA